MQPYGKHFLNIRKSRNEILNSLTSLSLMCYARLAAQIDIEEEPHSPKTNLPLPILYHNMSYVARV